MRAGGDGTWTFTVVVDRECRHGLDQLKSLLSHVDPAMSYGQLVNRLVQDELRRRDPRLRGSTGTDTRPAATGGPAAKRTTHAESAKHPGSNGAAAAKRAAATAGAPSASKREAQPVHDGPPAENGTSPEPAEAVSTAKCVAVDGGTAHSNPNQPGIGDAGRQQPAPTGRGIAAAIKRAVWERDQGRCSYVDPTTGRRCSSRHLLQIDHIRPWARGGGARLDNLRLLCHAHHRHRHAGPSFPRPGPH
ncbi:MAG: HNH endonuclease signature motif containing protein [Spirochaetaceae bacterium]|nr:HNH endonuclease signature motif containing protein [Spirochaetaceae bacterium]